MVLLGDEVGVNIDMIDYGHIGGDKLLCKKGCITRIKQQQKWNISQLLGLQNLPIKPICCIVFIEGKQQLFDFRAGIDLSTEKVGDESDGEEYFGMNVGSGKYHTVGITYNYKGGGSYLSCRIFWEWEHIREYPHERT